MLGLPLPSLPGLPSMHGIVEAIAKGFFQALAHALVPSWLTHGTVGTLQHLVALPDPASWSHVAALQGEMVYLGAMLLPATLALGTVRYWLLGLTGAAHPVMAVSRSVWAAFVLIAYKWLVEQIVAMANTLSHAVLGLPVVAEGLRRIVGVLFGGALLGGVGGVFGAILVMLGVVLAGALFAAQVAVTVVLAVSMVLGPPLIALTPMPESAHLARVWANALVMVALVPVGWTVLFATAGALCLDATSFTGGARGGLPGHVAAALAGLVTLAIAVKLALTVFGQLRHLFSAGGVGAGATAATGPSQVPGAERVRTAHARLRSAVYQGIPSLGASAGAAAGALGAPAGGLFGVARRRLGATRAGARSPVGNASASAGRAARGGSRRAGRPSVRERLRGAAAVLAGAPRQARQAMSATARPKRMRARSPGRPSVTGPGTERARKGASPSKGQGRRGSGSSTGQAAARTTGSPRPRSKAASASSSQSAPAGAGARPRASAKPARMPKADGPPRAGQAKPRQGTKGARTQRPKPPPSPPPSSKSAPRAAGRAPRRKPRPRKGR